MALSQIQCLDDNHVNPRTTESKPEFLYCENQRLALEALLRDGREAFVKYLGASGLRCFLSDPELETLAEAVEPFDPGLELFPDDAEEDEPPLSQHYWPELSDTSIPQMDLGWPDSASYRGVTRTTVYTQPPLEGQTHIKEVVRKMIAQAQKVIAVVMDIFTDVDIFRDLLDAVFKRKVSVYILLERKALPHFRSMCQRADMHAGHLKNLRVRCTDGAEFHTRSCKRVRGRMGHRFMFIDGDKTVSGSYGFTWMSSRLDKNLITVVTGQAVDTFDRLFRVLYASSSFVDLRQVATEPEPELEPAPQVVTVVAAPADIARKLNSPKYALVALSNPSPTPSASPKGTQNPEEDPKSPETKKRRRGRASKEAAQEAPPLHPGLTDLEKACLISYLPTWPEPDPPSDVIGFINIRDASKPNQVHLQRSEMFERSQAIKFSSPFSMPKEVLPEVAKPRQFTAKPVEKNKLQPAQDSAKAKESQPAQLNAGAGDIKSKAEAPGQKPPASGPKCESKKDTTKALNSENKQHSNTNQDAGHNTTPQLNAHTPRQSSSKASTPDTTRPSQTVATLPELNTETSSNTHRPVVVRTNTLESSSTHTSHLHRPADAETHMQTKKLPPHIDSHTQPQNSAEITTKIPTSPTSVSPTSVSENNHISINKSTTPSSPLLFIPYSSSIPRLISSSTPSNRPVPPSSASPSLTSTPPVPKPRTVQLVMKGGIPGDSQKLPEFSVVRRSETNTGSLVVGNEPNVAKKGQELPEKGPETVPELHNNSGSQTLAQKDSENKEEAPQQKQSGTSQEIKNEEEAGRHDDRAGMQLDAGNNLEAQTDVMITDAPEAESRIVQEVIPKDVEPMLIDCKLTPQTDCAATVQTEKKAPETTLTGCEFSEVLNEKTYLAKAHAPQRISYSELTPQYTDVLDSVDPLKTPTQTPIPATHISKDSTGTHTSAADTQGQQGYPSFIPAHHTDSMPDTAKQNTHSTFQEQTPKARGSTHTPERPLRLHLTDINVPDLRSPTPERESRLLVALTRTPTPDGYNPCTPTSDSRTHTPDSRSYTPDFRTPTPDGYFSPRTDSALSTASDEYYECNDSPLHEAVSDQAASRSHGTIEDHVSFTLTNTPNATGITTSPACLNSNSLAATLGATDRNTSNSETQSVSGPAKVSSSSSSLEKKVKTVEEKETGNEENGREEVDKGTSLEGDYQGTKRRGSEEAKRTAEHLQQIVDLTETKDINNEAQPQAAKRKKVLNQSAAETPVDERLSPAELTNERTEPKQLSTGDPQPKKATPEVKRPDKEKTVDKAASGASGVERRDRQPTRETDGQKLLRTPSKTQRGQQQGSGSSSPSRPARPPRPLSANPALGPLPSGGRQLNQTESKVLHGSLQVLDNASSPRRPPSRPPPPATAGAVGAAAGRKQAEVSRGQQSLLSRQPLSAQGRMRAGQSQNQHFYPKPQASFLHTHSNREAQLHHHSQNQTVAQREAHWQEEGRTPFSFTFSRLYNLKGLKDKMGKLPSQSKRGSSSSPGQGRKSTS